MDVREKILEYISSLSVHKRNDILDLHKLITKIMPNCKLWYLDGKDENGKIVSNPSIGYGLRTINYANGKTKDFYQVGISANKSGISVYILGLHDKEYLKQTYSATLGKANVSGYCIKLRSLKDINLNILEYAILDGFRQSTVN